eukprot:c5326_g1_i1.p1 GENE.c5326_g1_i1~~c5326_g1_i1.p1  ORF type:complete len:109 (-),score=26.47 c5326_g1_i1:51-377(-)
MPIRHTVLLKFVDTCTLEQKQTIVNELSKMPAAIPQIRNFSCRLDAGLDNDRNSHIIVLAEFDNVADYEIYAKHEAHQNVIVTFIRPFIAPGGRAAVQSEIPAFSSNL